MIDLYRNFVLNEGMQSRFMLCISYYHIRIVSLNGQNSREGGNSMKKKIIIVLVCVIVLLVAGRLGYAYWFHQHLIETYGKNMEYMEDVGYSKDIGDDWYVLQLHDWWEIWGGLQISSTMRLGDNGVENECYRIYINLTKSVEDPEVDLMLYYRAEDGTIKRIRFLLDEHMQLIDPENATNVQKQVLEEQRDWIREIYQKVYDMWGILEPDAA